MTEANKVRAKELVWLYVFTLLILIAWIGIFRFLFNLRGVQLERLSAVFANFCVFGVLVLWAHKMKGMNLHELGLRRGRWSIKRSMLCGLAVGTGVFIVPLVCMGWAGKFVSGLPKNWLFLSFILPLSFVGMSQLILGPIIEEVIDRGLLFSYLKTRYGVSRGLVIQALIFSAMHPFHISRGIGHFAIYFSGGLVLGILFEKSDSLYPGIIAHSALNYGNLLLGSIRL